tara:strand:- start:245 stop:814 length:570 start_codon:yes stop_codon:yes gene_type:complete
MNTLFQEKTLVVSLCEDEFICGKFYLAENNIKNIVNTMYTSTSGKITRLYFYVLNWLEYIDETEFIELVNSGEYDERIYSAFEKLCYYHKDTKTFGPVGITNSDEGISIVFNYLLDIKAIHKFDTQRLANLAYNTQLFLENRIVEYFNHLHQLYPEYLNIAVKGDIFNNIKLRQRLNDLNWAREVNMYE